MMMSLKVFILIMSFPFFIDAKDNPNVCLETGACYEGSWWYVDDDVADFASFQGIRYAQAPIGNLRFKPPVPYFDAKGTYDVGREQYKTCAQPMNNGSVVGTEDCLYLNVYVPESAIKNPEAKLPVMVWIHGGALRTGANWYASYGPKHFMAKDVIVVAINYRLGPMGFLSLGSNEVPGNAGFRDQILALSWVRDNINKFGGDPNTVTIFGESAGAFSVQLQLLSPLSEGLFKRAIMQSTYGISPGKRTLTPEQALGAADYAYEQFGCSQAENKLLCLQSQELQDLVNFQFWGPVPDVDFTSEPFLTAMPEQILASGPFNTDIEVIIGTNADEGLLGMFDVIKDPSKWKDFRDNFDTEGPRRIFGLPYPQEITEQLVEKAHKVADFYVGGVENFDEDHLDKIIDMWTDSGFLYSTYKMVYFLTRWSIPTFQYVLNFQGQFSFTEKFGIETMGVCHADDLLYLFSPVMVRGNLPLNETEMALRETMTTAWTNFAKFGDPTPPGKSTRSESLFSILISNIYF